MVGDVHRGWWLAVVMGILMAPVPAQVQTTVCGTVPAVGVVYRVADAHLRLQPL